MGMSSSQARYLALTARKTNTEWEGQQINQARTALANQSANLFNQLLALEVPNAPKTTDYTEVQYSYTDGENKAVIDSWEQLSNSDNDYNYVVNHYYNAKIYKGSKKQLGNPQVHIQKDLLVENYIDPTVVLKDDGSYSVIFPDGSLHNCEEITVSKIRNNNVLAKDFNSFIQDKGIELEPSELPEKEFYGYMDVSGAWKFYTDSDLKQIGEMRPTSIYNEQAKKYSVTTADGLKNIDYTQLSLLEKDDKFDVAFQNFADNVKGVTRENTYGYKDSDGTWHFSLKKDLENLSKQRPEVLFDPINNSYTVKASDGSLNIYQDPNKFMEIEGFESALRDFEEISNIIEDGENLKMDDIYAKMDEAGNFHFFLASDIENPRDYTSKLTGYVGNSKLTELLTLNNDQAAELAQVLKDCNDSAISNYISFDNNGDLVYEGQGIYTFELNGKKYFTTSEDLNYSMSTPHIPEKPIDIQDKLVYYNATYVDSKIEATNNAMIETDNEGRFVSVKFDDDSVVYSLNVETVTDDDAYKDAMNEYSFKKEQYEKIIADINAQTSIIQQEDRTLELRLKQLDTEQNALATEMDSVKKVIKDNVEKVFKTFND